MSKRVVWYMIWTSFISVISSLTTMNVLNRSEVELRDQDGELRVRISASAKAGEVVLFADDGTRILLSASSQSRIAILSPDNVPSIVITRTESGVNMIGFNDDKGPKFSSDIEGALYEKIVWTDKFKVAVGLTRAGEVIAFPNPEDAHGPAQP